MYRISLLRVQYNGRSKPAANTRHLLNAQTPATKRPLHKNGVRAEKIKRVRLHRSLVELVKINRV